MRSLIRYLLKNHAFVLFILLETLALAMVFNYNSFQKATYLNSANRVTGKVYAIYQSVTGYFGLTKINRELAQENARLRMLLENQPEFIANTDSIFLNLPESDSVYRFIPAEIISNSVNRPFNYITLNKGSRHGIKPDMGIISASGIVGVVGQVSASYSMGLSVLNQRWSISAKLKKNGYYGSLIWDGIDYRMANFNEIPLHVDVAVGDTVVTSGYSSIFPEGILVGTVTGFSEPDGENYYSIQVRLSVDFKSLSHVEVVENRLRNEIDELDKKLREDGQTD
ncbi:rod shape-determining protein MreC [Mariniphaga sp.]|uniref:rod shape-determining protein MreC n=1 Tax=Mariniphaga sp. TaxID=1954475 RepID=UPI003561B7F6